MPASSRTLPGTSSTGLPLSQEWQKRDGDACMLHSCWNDHCLPWRLSAWSMYSTSAAPCSPAMHKTLEQCAPAVQYVVRVLCCWLRGAATESTYRMHCRRSVYSITIGWTRGTQHCTKPS